MTQFDLSRCISAPFLDASNGKEEIPVAIIDLDNCFSNDKWRWPLFDLHLPVVNDRYQRYHEACESDTFENVSTLREMSAHHYLLPFTSRPESVRLKTQRWLNRYRIPNIGMFMRPNDNHEPSVPLKRAMLKALPPQFKVYMAVDDRHDILDMHVGEGVPRVMQVIINQPEVIHP